MEMSTSHLPGRLTSAVLLRRPDRVYQNRGTIALASDPNAPRGVYMYHA